jgi:hypothetical protein
MRGRRGVLRSGHPVDANGFARDRPADAASRRGGTGQLPPRGAALPQPPAAVRLPSAMAGRRRARGEDRPPGSVRVGTGARVIRSAACAARNRLPFVNLAVAGAGAWFRFCS